MNSPETAYKAQHQKFSALLQQLEARRRSLGWARLVTFLITVALAYYFFTSHGLVGLVPTVLGLAALLYLVSVDVANNVRIRNTKTLLQVNEEELLALAGQFGHREDGQRFLSGEHAYAADLDIFGAASVYQWLGRCYTEQGQALLAQNLQHPLPADAVLQRQKAVDELTPQLDWRQQWQAHAMQTTVTQKTEQKLQAWLENEAPQFAHRAWHTGVLAYSGLTLASAVAALLGFIPGSLFSTLFLLYLVLSLYLARFALPAYSHLGGIVKEAGTLQALVEWLEGLNATTPHLKDLQQKLMGDEKPASTQLAELKKILDRFDLRASVIGVLFLNPFLLWDVRQVLALNTWRQRNKASVAHWFAAVSETEVLHSLCTLRFNHPEWCVPQFAAEHFTLKAEALGHPLLPPAQRVDNDFALQGLAKIGLITGSNMAGKSTFLRSLGVNTVLAQMGGVVCAKSFLLSPVQVVSSMRIADNLAENTSTFYAELKKLRTIIERVKAHEKVFVLLDEILRGTNSFDRHKGSAALIRQLIREDAVAVIATHDVELAQLAETYPEALTNYHFDVEVEGEELYFDYKLKGGICRSLNASILMKKIGIDLP